VLHNWFKAIFGYNFLGVFVTFKKKLKKKLPMDDHHFGYKQKFLEKNTHTHTHTHTHTQKFKPIVMIFEGFILHRKYSVHATLLLLLVELVGCCKSICWPLHTKARMDIVFRFIIEYSSLRDFYRPLGNNNNNNNNNRSIFMWGFLKDDIFWLVLKLKIN